MVQRLSGQQFGSQAPGKTRVAARPRAETQSWPGGLPFLSVQRRGKQTRRIAQVDRPDAISRASVDTAGVAPCLHRHSFGAIDPSACIANRPAKRLLWRWPCPWFGSGRSRAHRFSPPRIAVWLSRPGFGRALSTKSARILPRSALIWQGSTKPHAVTLRRSAASPGDHGYERLLKRPSGKPGPFNDRAHLRSRLVLP